MICNTQTFLSVLRPICSLLSPYYFWLDTVKRSGTRLDKTRRRGKRVGRGQGVQEG